MRRLVSLICDEVSSLQRVFDATLDASENMERHAVPNAPVSRQKNVAFNRWPRQMEANEERPAKEVPKSLTIVALGYRARCTEAGCGNLARLGFRYADAGGRPMKNVEFCFAHARGPAARPARRVRSGGDKHTPQAKVDIARREQQIVALRLRDDLLLAAFGYLG